MDAEGYDLCWSHVIKKSVNDEYYLAGSVTTLWRLNKNQKNGEDLNSCLMLIYYSIIRFSPNGKKIQKTPGALQ